MGDDTDDDSSNEIKNGSESVCFEFDSSGNLKNRKQKYVFYDKQNKLELFESAKKRGEKLCAVMKFDYSKIYFQKLKQRCENPVLFITQNTKRDFPTLKSVCGGLKVYLVHGEFGDTVMHSATILHADTKSIMRKSIKKRIFTVRVAIKDFEKLDEPIKFYKFIKLFGDTCITPGLWFYSICYDPVNNQK